MTYLRKQDLIFFDLYYNSIDTRAQPISNLIDGGAQVQQIVKVECLETFTEAPQLEVSFT